jgi:hypothetical protein
MNLIGAIWSDNAPSMLRVSPDLAFPSRNCFRPIGLDASVLMSLFIGSYWVVRRSASKNRCCDFCLLCGRVCTWGQRAREVRLPPATRAGVRSGAVDRKVSRNCSPEGERLPSEQVHSFRNVVGMPDEPTISQSSSTPLAGTPRTLSRHRNAECCSQSRPENPRQQSVPSRSGVFPRSAGRASTLHHLPE